MTELGVKNLKNAEALFEAIYQDSPIGIEIYDSNGKLIDLNKSCMQLFGLSSKADVKGFDLLKDPNIPNEQISKLKNGESVNYESYFDFELVRTKNLYETSKTGEIYIDVLITPLFLGDDKSISSYLVHIQDISDRKISEMKLIDFNKDLETQIRERTIQLRKSEEKSQDLQNNSEKKLTNLIEAIPVGVTLTSYDEKIYDCNSQAVSMLGYDSKEEFLEISSSDLYFNPKDRDRFLELHRKGLIKDFEVLAKRKDGTNFWVSITSKKQTTGNQTSFINIFQDITERKMTDQKLKESEERFRSTFENAAIGIAHNGLDGTFLRVNQGLCDIVKYSREELYNLTFQDITYQDDLDTDLDYVSQLLDNKIQSFMMEKRYICKDGTPVWVNLAGSLVREQSGEPKYFIAVVEDITERKVAAQKLKESEKKLRKLNNEVEMILDYLPGLVFYKDASNNFLRVNKNLADAHSMTKEELRDTSLFDIYPQEQAQAYWDDDLEVIKSGKAKLNIEEPWDTDEGRKWVSTSKIPFFDENTKVTGIIGFSSDITEHKKAEEKLKESEEKFRTIVEQSLLSISITQEGRIVFANLALANLMEYSIEEITNWTDVDSMKTIYKEDLPLVTDILKSRQEGDINTIFKYTCRIITKSKKIIWVEIHSKPIIYQGKKAILSSQIDITNQKKAEENLTEISKLKSELLSRTSHELKTPLVSIKGYVDLLLQVHYENLDFYTISMLHEIRQGCSRLESLIKDLLQTSELETGMIVLRKEREDLSFLIKYCLKELQGLANIRHHKIFLNIEENMITMFEKERIYEVIVNLLSNALKYTQPKGVIKIGSEVKNNSYIISFEDNGIGLSETDKQKLFKKFGKIERYGRGLDVFSEGSGLGLYISKGMIELHDGEIWVESKGNGKGSTFYFSLPIVND